MTGTPIQPTADQLAMAGRHHSKDELSRFLGEIAEEDAALEAGTLAPPAHPSDAPNYETLSIDGSDTEARESGRLLAGKYQSVEDLERGYEELQRKLGQPRDPSAPAEAAPAAQPSSREQQIEAYGEAVVAAAEEQGIDLARWDAAVRRGEDTAPMRQALGQALGLPTSLIEQYEAQFRPAAPAASQPPAASQQGPGLSDADVAAIRAEVGGDAAFAQLGQWAVSNLKPQELADYNAAIDSGNPAAARAAVRWLKTAASAAPREQPLALAAGGNASPQLDVFESETEAIEAKNARTEGGKLRYLVDERYRRYIDAKFARSNIFR